MSTLKKNTSIGFLLDPFQPTAEAVPQKYRFPAGAKRTRTFLIAGVILLLIGFAGIFVDRQHFFFSYLTAYMFALTLTWGAMFFVMVHHLTRAEWSTTFRRIPELLLWGFPVLGLLAIPILFGMHDLYHWTHPEVYDPNSPAYDAILAGKRGYLNIPFFVIRLVIYFVGWTFISYKLYQLSLEQDLTGDPGIPLRFRKVSAPGLIFFALSVAFASYDFLMSLDPHWFSTIFGVYVFAASVFGGLAFLVLLGRYVQRHGSLRSEVTVEHYQDLGKLMLAFTAFWAYIAYSQYMLQWYGNLPEEIVWYMDRLNEGWLPVSKLLVWGHFIIPFLLLLLRASKRVLPVLTTIAVWFLVIHYIDLYWLAMPTFSEHGPAWSWMDLALWLGMGSLLLSFFLYRAGRHGLTPYRDPYFTRSLAFENV